jgi:hypothetical protein
MFFDEIGEMQGGGETGGACTDDEDVGFELFALDGHCLCHLNKGRLWLADVMELVRQYDQCLNRSEQGPPRGFLISVHSKEDQAACFVEVM